MMTRQRWTGVALGAGFLAAGLAGMAGLISLRKPPAQAMAAADEHALRVQVLTAQPTDLTVTLTGYGQVQSIRTVEMAAEVSGTVISTHPRLVTGGVVHAGEVLFAIDPRSYEAAVDQAAARIAELDAESHRLASELANDHDRLIAMRRNSELAKSRFDRANKLREGAIGDQVAVDEAERAMHDATDAVHILERQIDANPMRVEEIRQQKAGQEALEKLVRLNLANAEVRAPFDGRLVAVMVERGQYVSQGRPVVRLADDSSLEISVKLDAQEAREWLRFDSKTQPSDVAWFSGLEPVRCEVRWAEDAEGPAWEGRLDRVETFDPQTRTLAVVVRVSAPQARDPGDGGLPLVSGMFCNVNIPGRVLSGVYRLSQSAVTVDRTVHLAADSRLHSVPVEIVRREGDAVFVRGGLNPGDLLITTRLVNVLENSRLEVEMERADSTATGD
jgi:RND family efflux transporter MFP subunit